MEYKCYSGNTGSRFLSPKFTGFSAKNFGSNEEDVRPQKKERPAGQSPQDVLKCSYLSIYSALLPVWASTTAMAAMFTMSRTLAPSCRMCTGLRMPISTGPITSVPLISCNTL